MAKTCLQLVQTAMGELGLPVPTVVTSSTDTQVKQFLALLNGLGEELSHEYDWQALTKQYVFRIANPVTFTGDTSAGSFLIFNTVPTLALLDQYQITGTGLNQATFSTSTSGTNTVPISQPATSAGTGTSFTAARVKFPMPSDYDRQVDRTQWDKSKHWEMQGPCTAQEWEWLLSGYISTGPRIRYRILGSYFQIWPMNTSNEVLGFEYVSNAWAESAAAAAQSSFLADTDTCMFSDRLMAAGLKLKYWEIKGFDTDKLQTAFDRELSISKANDAGSKTLSMAPQLSNVLISWDQIPDSGYGS